jgi:hypothetical protein
MFTIWLTTLGLFGILRDMDKCSIRRCVVEQKDEYTLQELFDNLEVTVTELSQRSGISDVTLGRVYKGQSVRRKTMNVLLRVFSEIYGRRFSSRNVTGIIIQGKHLNQKPVSAPDKAFPTDYTAQQKKPRIRDVGTRGTKEVPIPDDLPLGTVKAVDFVNKHGIPDSSFSRWCKDGIKGEKIETTMRPKPDGMGVQHFLTPAQQEKAIDLLKRHGKLES